MEGRRPHEFFWLEACTGMAAIAWSFYVLVFDETMRGQKAYDYLTAYVTPCTWAWIGITVGVMQCIATAVPCLPDLPPRVVGVATTARLAAAMLAVMWWHVTTMTLMRSDALSPMSMVALVIGLFQMPVIIKVFPGLLFWSRKT